MTEGESWLDHGPSADLYATSPPGIPGLIEGTMTMHHEPCGSVSLRVVIGGNGGKTGEGDLLEIVISADDLANVGWMLARHGTGDAAEAGHMPPFCCRIGFCSKGPRTAA